MSHLYILDSSPLLFISFAIIFSHTIGCLFCSWFPLSNVFKLFGSYLFIFAFISFVLDTPPPKYSYDLCQCYAVFSPSFMGSGLTFRSLIHFEFIRCEKCSLIILLCSSPVFPASLLQETVFSPFFFSCIFSPFVID